MGMSMEMNKGHAKSANGKYYFPAVYEKNTKTKQNILADILVK